MKNICIALLYACACVHADKGFAMGGGEDPQTMVYKTCPAELTDCMSNDDCVTFFEGVLASLYGMGAAPTTEEAQLAGPEAYALFECMEGGGLTPQAFGVQVEGADQCRTEEATVVVPGFSNPIETMPANFGPQVWEPVRNVPVQLASPLDGCSPLTNTAFPAGGGGLLLVERGTCGFATKVYHGEQVGASAVVIYHNTANKSGVGAMTCDPNSDEGWEFAANPALHQDIRVAVEWQCQGLGIPSVFIESAQGQMLKAAITASHGGARASLRCAEGAFSPVGCVAFFDGDWVLQVAAGSSACSAVVAELNKVDDIGGVKCTGDRSEPNEHDGSLYTGSGDTCDAAAGALNSFDGIAGVDCGYDYSSVLLITKANGGETQCLKVAAKMNEMLAGAACNRVGTYQTDGTCKCTDPTAAGPACEFSNAKTCSDAGIAQADGSCVCTDPAVGVGRCDCSGDATCPFSNAKTCSDAGVAQPDGTCVCTDPAVGVGFSCEHSNAKTCSDAGVAQADGTCVCTDPAVGVGRCDCSGDATCPFSNAKTCSDAGVAQADGTCVCTDPAVGAGRCDCSGDATCPFSNAKTCSGAGVVDAAGQCTCTDPAVGAGRCDCSGDTTCPFSNAKTCTSHGVLQADKSCDCDFGYSGADCSGPCTDAFDRFSTDGFPLEYSASSTESFWCTSDAEVCAAGSFFDTTSNATVGGGGDCALCPSGQYATESGVRILCTLCTTDTTKPQITQPGATAQADCAAKYQLVDHTEKEFCYGSGDDGAASPLFGVADATSCEEAATSTGKVYGGEFNQPVGCYYDAAAGQAGEVRFFVPDFVEGNRHLAGDKKWDAMCERFQECTDTLSTIQPLKPTADPGARPDCAQSNAQVSAEATKEAEAYSKTFMPAAIVTTLSIGIIAYVIVYRKGIPDKRKLISIELLKFVILGVLVRVFDMLTDVGFYSQILRGKSFESAYGVNYDESGVAIPLDAEVGATEAGGTGRYHPKVVAIQSAAFFFSMFGIIISTADIVFSGKRFLDEQNKQKDDDVKPQDVGMGIIILVCVAEDVPQLAINIEYIKTMIPFSIDCSDAAMAKIAGCEDYSAVDPLSIVSLVFSIVGIGYNVWVLIKWYRKNNDDGAAPFSKMMSKAFGLASDAGSDHVNLVFEDVKVTTPE